MTSPDVTVTVPNPPAFVRAGRGSKVRCTVCGRTGYDTGDHPRGWMAACRRGHLPCPHGCGRMLAVKLDGTARLHSRHHCPRRPS